MSLVKTQKKRSQARPSNPDRRLAAKRAEVEGENWEYSPPPGYDPAPIVNPYPPEVWQHRFLIEFARFPNVTRAAAFAQISPQYVNRHRKENEQFAELCKQCEDSALDQLEQTVYERSLNPWDPGSAGLSKWLLSSRRPETYSLSTRVKHDHELHTRDDKPLAIQVEQIDYRSYLGAIAPPDRSLIEGEKVQDIEDDDDDLADFREILGNED
jgi:hypothetical protein